MTIKITTKNIVRDYEAQTGQEAVQMFFDDIRAGKVSLYDLGFIGQWVGRGAGETHEQKHPFRIGPALFECGLLSQDDLDASFRNAGLVFTPHEVAGIAKADSWMVRQ